MNVMNICDKINKMRREVGREIHFHVNGVILPEEVEYFFL